MNKNSCAGFTLIEVMVALVIFAVLSVTLLTRLGENLRAEHYLQTKLLATQVADNALNELRIKRDWSAIADKSDEVDMAGQTWQVKMSVVDTDNENLKKVEVQVGQKADHGSDIHYVVSLTSYLGRY